MVELIDLSGYVEAGQPVYSSNQRTQFWTTSTHEEAGYAQLQQVDEPTDTIERHLSRAEEGEHVQTRAMLLSEHGPTHVDALSHIHPKYYPEETIDAMSLDRFYGDAVGIDVSHVAPEEFITIDDVRNALADYDLEIRDGDAITLHTGHRKRHYGLDGYEKRHAYVTEYTGLDGDAAAWLGERGVGNIGIDAPSIDHASGLETAEYPAHDMCAEYRMINMENLANLDRVAGLRYTLCAFPLKLRDGTGSPIRPVAILEE